MRTREHIGFMVNSFLIFFTRYIQGRNERMFPGAGSNENVGDAVATLPPPDERSGVMHLLTNNKNSFQNERKLTGFLLFSYQRTDLIN